MGVLPPFPNFLLFLSFYSTLRQYRVTLSCWESGLLSSPISLFHFQSKSGTLPFPLKGYGPTALILTQDSLPSLHGRLANYGGHESRGTRTTPRGAAHQLQQSCISAQQKHKKHIKLVKTEMARNAKNLNLAKGMVTDENMTKALTSMIEPAPDPRPRRPPVARPMWPKCDPCCVDHPPAPRGLSR